MKKNMKKKKMSVNKQKKKSMIAIIQQYTHELLLWESKSIEQIC